MVGWWVYASFCSTGFIRAFDKPQNSLKRWLFQDFSIECDKGFGAKVVFEIEVASRVTVHHLQHISMWILFYSTFECCYWAKMLFFCNFCVSKDFAGLH